MSKEFILNGATGRFQLNYKKNVGAVSALIRTCHPKTLKEWEEYYFSHGKKKEHIENLGRKLYVKITEKIHKELNEITEQDCINYMMNLVINRTFEGYQNEIKTIYGYLEKELGVAIQASSDEWDRRYNVDFYLKVGKLFVGIQIKPDHRGLNLYQMHKEKKFQDHAHTAFTEKYGGKCFLVYSYTEGRRKVIKNIEVIEEIRQEMRRLEKSPNA